MECATTYDQAEEPGKNWKQQIELEFNGQGPKRSIKLSRELTTYAEGQKNPEIMPVARMQELWMEEQDHQKDRRIISWKNAKDAADIKATKPRPRTIEEQGFGIRQKEQKARKKKKEHNS